MENYFILLELPFDLPESDTNKISEAISKKQAQWSRDQSNPVKKAKASEYLAALEDIKKVMLDPTARKQEAAKAKQIKASKAKELEAKLSLYRAKGDELSEKDLKRLVKIFGAFGFTADEIKKKFGSGNKKQDKIDPSEVLDKTQARNVQNFMQQLDMKEKTLYDFLSLAPTASWNQLCEAADSMKKKILANGFSIDPSVASKVTAVLKEVESQLAIMRNASGDEAFTIAMKLTELIADSDELNQSLKKFPPDEVPAVSSKRVGDEITLTWKPSPSIGEITYVVVRKENTYPNGPTDGSTVYNGKELAYTDSNAPKNTVLYYSVFAVRIGVHSKATRLDEAVAIVGKVTNLKAIGGDEMVTLSWTKAPTVTEIRLYKYCGYERPQDDSQYETIPCTRLDGLLVSGLTNGTNYWFAISAGHTLNGKTYFSEKAYLSAVPQKPAKPLQDFSVQLIDEVFQAKWTQSEWDVILFYAKQKPEYAVGTIYDLNELLSKYEKIDINLKSLTEAE